MSAAALDSDSSQSSSGYEDGLGRRVLAFDRESGTMLERLMLRPELCAFEKALAERLKIVAALDDERFAKPRAIEHLFDGSLIVVSEYVGGRRLSDILDAAAEYGIVAGLDAGLGLLLELLPAVARLHDAGLAHGALAPGRVMITPAGQILLLDAIYAEPLERLQLTRKRLWSELRLAFPPTAGTAHFDKAADLSHAAMIAASLIVGRPLRDDDYPDGIPTLRQEILEIASIRGSKAFADAIDKFFAGTLPMAGKRGIVSADEAAIDLRKLVRKELGINTCRTALVEFFQQVESADAERIAAEAAHRDTHARQESERISTEQAEAARREAARLEAERVAKERAEAERIAKERAEAERKERERLEAERIAKERAEAERKERERLEAERIAKERAEAERKERERLEAERIAKERAEAERKERERLEAERIAKERAEAERKERERLEAERIAKERAEAERRERERLEAERIAREKAEAARRERERLEAERIAKERAEAERREKERLEAVRLERERLEAERRERERLEKEARERAEKERLEKERLEAERRARERLERERLEKEARERAEKARLEVERLERERVEAERRERERVAQEAQARADRERLEAERRERAARERQEREEAERARVEAEHAQPEPAEPVVAGAPPPPPASQSGGWLIPPDRAASFEPAVPEAPPPAPTARVYPIYVPPAEPAAWTPDVPPEPERIEIRPVASATPAQPIAPIKPSSGTGLGPIRIKTDSGLSIADATPARAEHRSEPEEMSAAGAYEPFGYTEAKQPIPWKLIAAGVVLIAMTFAISRGYTPAAAPVIENARKVVPKPTAPPPTTTVSSASPGQVAVKTEPAGLKILLDGKAAGESPLTLNNVSTGRHVVTILGDGGSLKRIIRVEPGQGVTIDVPVFAGFAKISAPFVVEIAENGKSLGTSEDQVILGPGRHQLHLSNADLGYQATETVEVQPGEVTQISVDPRGRANINAVPWAEVWIDGEKAGETPLANVPIRLGVREITFKNPQFPDRKVVVTVKAGVPETVAVDFNKDR